MKRMILSAAAIGALVTLTAPAQARDGCGGGLHRTPHGRCVPNRGGYGPGRPGPGHGVGRPGPALVIGTYYPGRGYWYNNRYWQHRYRHRNDWRYR